MSQHAIPSDNTLPTMENADLLWHLGQVRLLRGLSDEELETIAQYSREHLFPEGTIIFRQGGEADALHFLNRGTVMLSMENSSGRRKIMSILHKSEVFGEDVLSTSQKYQVQAVALEDCWCSTLSKDQLLRLLREKPVLSGNLVQLILQRLGEARNQIEALSLMNTRERLANVLLKLARDIGSPNRFRKEWVKLRLKIPHERLAEIVGANRPHISSMLSEFRKSGWIDYQNHKLMIDTSALEKQEVTEFALSTEGLS